jgi:protein SCO1
MILLLLILAFTFSSADFSNASVSFTPDWQKISGKKLPDVEFIDSHEKIVRLSDYSGKILILHPMFTHCQSTCAFISSRLSAAIKGLPGLERNNFEILSFSFDPAETSESLTKFEKMFHWKVVRGDAAMVQQLLAALDYRTLQLNTSNYEHPNLLFVVGKDGVLRDYIYGSDLTSDRLASLLQSSRTLSTAKPYIYIAALLGLLISTFVAVSRITKVQRQSPITKKESTTSSTP